MRTHLHPNRWSLPVIPIPARFLWMIATLNLILIVWQGKNGQTHLVMEEREIGGIEGGPDIQLRMPFLAWRMSLRKSGQWDPGLPIVVEMRGKKRTPVLHLILSPWAIVLTSWRPCKYWHSFIWRLSRTYMKIQGGGRYLWNSHWTKRLTGFTKLFQIISRWHYIS